MIHTWFEVKIRYSKMQENGVEKMVTESYLFDALSCTEAEARAIGEITQYISREVQITSVKRVKFSDIFLGEGDYFFKCKTINESGTGKKTSTNMLVQASDFRQALKNLDKGMEGTMADYQIAAISETAIMDVYPYSPKDESEVNNG